MHPMKIDLHHRRNPGFNEIGVRFAFDQMKLSTPLCLCLCFLLLTRFGNVIANLL